MFYRSGIVLYGIVVVALLSFHPHSSLAANEQVVYADSLNSSWQDWSWNTTRNLSNASPVQTGSASLSAAFTAAWGGLYLHTTSTLSGNDYVSVRFSIHGGSAGGQRIQFKVIDGSDGNWSNSFSVTPQANAWNTITVPLSSVGSPQSISGIAWQDASGGAQPTFYLDNIVLVGNTTTTNPATISLSVNASAGRHPISPYIYGMNFADEALAAELNLPVRRWGGNATTRYNWQNDTSNRASDWFFENIPNDNPNPGSLPNGSSSDRFIEQDRRTGTQSLLTVPLVGWTPKSRGFACGFSVAKYGAQQSTDSWNSDCGNGVKPDSSNATGNDPADTSTAITPSFVQDWIRHLNSRHGTAANGGVRFYDLDNEPMLWNSTHRDVHPLPTSYDELNQRTQSYASAIKAVDPGAQLLGPVVWGWTAYFYSALDTAPGGAWWNNPRDRNAHGGVPFVEWYLQQMRTYEQQNGVRLLDYVDVHYYPQGQNIFSPNLGDANTQALRLRSTRSLWDSTYADESWIGEPIYLVPRLRAWVNADYPGTKTAITEYNWGALGYLNGALAQADVLGIFGREGLDLATLWDPPTASQPGAFAFRLYRNYDGAGGQFGDTSVSATSTDQAQLGIYAAQRTSDSALTIMVINKSPSTISSNVSLAGLSPAGNAMAYRYSASNLGAIVRLPDRTSDATGFSATFPASSVTLYVVPVTAGSVTPRVWVPFASR